MTIIIGKRNQLDPHRENASGASQTSASLFTKGVIDQSKPDFRFRRCSGPGKLKTLVALHFLLASRGLHSRAIILVTANSQQNQRFLISIPTSRSLDFAKFGFLFVAK